MTVPTYDQLIELLLRVLATRPDGMSAQDARAELAVRLDLDESDLADLLPSGIQKRFDNRGIRSKLAVLMRPSQAGTAGDDGAGTASDNSAAPVSVRVGELGSLVSELG